MVGRGSAWIDSLCRRWGNQTLADDFMSKHWNDGRMFFRTAWLVGEAWWWWIPTGQDELQGGLLMAAFLSVGSCGTGAVVMLSRFFPSFLEIPLGLAFVGAYGTSSFLVFFFSDWNFVGSSVYLYRVLVIDKISSLSIFWFLYIRMAPFWIAFFVLLCLFLFSLL